MYALVVVLLFVVVVFFGCMVCLMLLVYRLRRRWRRGGGRKRYLFFQNFMVSKYLKNRDLMKKRIDVYMIYDFLIFMVSLLAWYFIIRRKGEICSHCYHDFLNSRRSREEEEGGGGRREGYLFFQNFMVSKYLKNRDLMKKENWCMHDLWFLISMLLLLAWFFIICGKGENVLSLWAWNFWIS